MLIRKSLSLLLFFLTACGGDFRAVEFEGAKIDKAFTPYLQEYKVDKLHYTGVDTVRKIDIMFWSLEANTIGQCSRKGEERQILIDPEHWFNVSYGDQMALLYHELGHCDLDYDHSKENSIMNPYGLHGWYFMTQRDYFLNLFFLKGK